MSTFSNISVWTLLFAISLAQNKGSPDLPSSKNMYNCNKGDTECWNAECLYWTDVIRKEAGVAPLAMGSVGMLDNAVSYSRQLNAKKRLKHQNIGAIKLPCGMKVASENIAYNFAEENPAWKCMNQWKKSTGHYNNIVRERIASVVTGVFISGEGRVSCTQIFSRTLPEGGQPKCEACPTNFPRGSSPKSAPKSATTMTATATPTQTLNQGMKKGMKICYKFILWSVWQCTYCSGSKYFNCVRT